LVGRGNKNVVVGCSNRVGCGVCVFINCRGEDVSNSDIGKCHGVRLEDGVVGGEDTDHCIREIQW